MLEDRQVRTGFSRRIEEEARRGDRAREGSRLRSARSAAISRPSRSTRPARTTSTTRSRRRRRTAASASGSTSRTSPPTSGRATRSRRRPTGGRTPPTSRASSRRCCPIVLSSDACSLAPERERLAVTSEIELSEAGEPLSASFYRSLIRSDVRLDYDELDEIFAGRAKPPQPIAAPLALAREAAATLAGRRPRGLARGGELRARVPLRGRPGHRRPLRPADRGAPADRAPDDPHQRAGRRAARAPSHPDALPGPRAAGSGADPMADRAARGARHPDPGPARRRSRRSRRASWPARRAAWSRARRSAAATAARRIHRLCFAR